MLHAGFPQRLGMLMAAHAKSQQGVIALARLPTQLDKEILALERYLDHFAPGEGVNAQSMLEHQQTHRRDAQLQLLAIGICRLVEINAIQFQTLAMLQIIVFCIRRQLSTMQLVQLTDFTLRLRRLIRQQLKAI